VRHLLPALLALFPSFTLAQPETRSRPAPQPGDLLKGRDAFGDWTTDAPGVRRLITIADLPAPNDTPSSTNMPRLVPQPEGAWPKVPEGFTADLLAKGLDNPRKVITAPNGDLFIAESQPGRIKVLRLGADGKVTTNQVFAEGLRQPFGLAFYPHGDNPQFLYIANTDSVVRIPYKTGDLTASADKDVVVKELPGGGRLTGGGHWTRDIVFSKDAKKMFVSVGSLSNVSDNAREKDRAAIHEYNPDGSGFRLYATGVRNAVGLAIHPQTGALWASVNERDGLGDDLPPEYITSIKDGGFYGWPWFYLGNHQDPRHKGKHPELADKVIVPDVLIQSHSASLCMTFYTGTHFPSRYRGMAFAAEHGSWNRSRRTGYKLICIPLQDGKATGEYEDFLTGFVTPEGNVWGRPVGITMASDGSLIMTEDGANTLWRIRYTGK
jgi:glucose/arabinose dehydrogenase